MSPEIILLAIGCYLFCGVEEKIYRIKTGDSREGRLDIDFEKELSEFKFIPNKTTYEQILEKFGKEYIEQQTHKVIRRQIYNGEKYYFNKELNYVYRKVQKLDIVVGYQLCHTDLDVNFFFKDNILVFYNIYDMRLPINSCEQYPGPFHMITDKEWLPGGKNYTSSTYNCNKKFYEIFTLKHRSEWIYADGCDFYNKEYWEDPIYKDKKYISDKNGWPCTGIFNTSC
jgi:hypothetical protein